MTIYTVEIKQIDEIEIDWHLQVEKRNFTLHCLAIHLIFMILLSKDIFVH